MNDIAHSVSVFVLNHLVPSVFANPMPLILVGSFVALNLGLYGFTRGREFLINSFMAALFLVPFVRFA